MPKLERADRRDRKQEARKRDKTMRGNRDWQHIQAAVAKRGREARKDLHDQVR